MIAEWIIELLATGPSRGVREFGFVLSDEEKGAGDEDGGWAVLGGAESSV